MSELTIKQKQKIVDYLKDEMRFFDKSDRGAAKELWDATPHTEYIPTDFESVWADPISKFYGIPNKFAILSQIYEDRPLTRVITVFWTDGYKESGIFMLIHEVADQIIPEDHTIVSHNLDDEFQHERMMARGYERVETLEGAAPTGDNLVKYEADPTDDFECDIEKLDLPEFDDEELLNSLETDD